LPDSGIETALWRSVQRGGIRNIRAPMELHGQLLSRIRSGMTKTPISVA